MLVCMHVYVAYKSRPINGTVEFCGVNITAAKIAVSLSRDFRITGVL